MNIIEGYHIHSKKLGEGGFGVVKLATHLLTKENVAIKIINKEKIKKDLFRVKNEITALQRLRHKNIAKLLQVIENNQFIFLIMEYCSGGELFDYLVSRSRLSENESRRIIRSLISVLAFIHAKGFAHRDIKPENILLDENQNIKLIDFGLCACSYMNPNGNLEGLSTCCGSPAYVAPELLMGAKYSGPVADIWSTGVLLYALLCGRLPFNNPQLPLLYKSIKEGHYEMPKFLSNSVQDLISKMLCVDPEKRIMLQDIMNHRWMNAPNKQWPKINLVEEILKEDESDLDEKILLKCSTLFPDINLNILRENIKLKNGYHSATYWLVKRKPELYPDFDHSVYKEINRRRSRSFSEFNLPKIKKVNKDDKPNSNEKTQKYKVKEKYPKTEIKTQINEIKQAIGIPRINKKTPINKKLFTDSNQHTKKYDSQELSPILPLVAVIESNKENIPSKLKAHSLDSQHQLPETPSMTPKKSLFKWILENATPRKTLLPRRFSSNNKNSVKNIILTGFMNADECVEKVLEILKTKQVNCKAKNFVIRCVLSTMNVIIVAFELEILICRNTGLVAIQHKRIRGTSWDYVKMCDDIKNELDKALRNNTNC